MEDNPSPIDMSKEFNKALSNFMNDFASGGAVRHMVKNGTTIAEITDRLDYPTPKAKVVQMVWKYYLEEGIIRLEAPLEDASDSIRKVTYVKEQDKYGRTSMRQVVTLVEQEGREYIPCHYGKRIYQNKEALGKELLASGMEEKWVKHILDLPWPLQEVWVEKGYFR